jgi:hypothetical protein
MCSKAVSLPAKRPARAVPEEPRGPAPGPNSFAPKPRFDYEAPSILWEHRYLAILFVAAIIIGSVYLFMAPHKPPPPAPATAPLQIEPPAVYVEPIPERPASSAH